MDFRQLQYFITIVDEGSITAASRKMCIAQPALTRQMHRLEQDLGVTLVERRRSGVVLTPAGQSFYDDASRLLAEFEMARIRASAVGHRQMETLRLGVTTIHSWIPDVAGLIQTLHQRHPKLDLAIQPMLAGAQIDAIRSGEIDAGMLILDPKSYPDLRTISVCDSGLVVVAKKDSDIARRAVHKMKDLNDFNFIWFEREFSPGSYDIVNKNFMDVGFSPAHTIICNDNTGMSCLVEANVGYTILPAWMKSSLSPSLTAFSIPELNVRLPLVVAWSQSRDLQVSPLFQ